VDEPKDFEAVLKRLQIALHDAYGKLRSADALALAGFKSSSYYRQLIVARALRELGWERGRFRFNGGMLYAYARGSQLEREALLDVERGDDDRVVVKRREP
jgi:hypothetical protein